MVGSLLDLARFLKLNLRARWLFFADAGGVHGSRGQQHEQQQQSGGGSHGWKWRPTVGDGTFLPVAGVKGLPDWKFVSLDLCSEQSTSVRGQETVNYCHR